MQCRVATVQTVSFGSRDFAEEGMLLKRPIGLVVLRGILQRLQRFGNIKLPVRPKE